MITQRIDITEGAWTEITGGSDILLVEGGVSGSFLLHFQNSQTPPAIDAPAHRVQTYQAPIDFTLFNLPLGQRLFARSFKGNSFVIVTREVEVYVNFIPLGSDSLLTANGNTFKVKEAA